MPGKQRRRAREDLKDVAGIRLAIKEKMEVAFNLLVSGVEGSVRKAGELTNQAAALGRRLERARELRERRDAKADVGGEDVKDTGRAVED